MASPRGTNGSTVSVRFGFVLLLVGAVVSSAGWLLVDRIRAGEWRGKIDATIEALDSRVRVLEER